MRETIKAILNEIRELYANKKRLEEAALPSGCYFIDRNKILAEKRYFGDARYPYSCDGLTMWAYSSGNIKIEESTFNIVLPFSEGKEPNLSFYVGKKNGKEFFPVSITGAGRLPFEKNIFRFTVFTPAAVYYFVKTKQLTACLRAFVDGEKNLRFTIGVENNGSEKIETYISAYFNLMLSHAPCENIETKWYRKSKASDNGFEISVTEYLNRNSCFTHRAEIKREKCSHGVTSTTSHTDFCGGMHNQLCCSESLRKGFFKEKKQYTEFTDTAIAGDIVSLELSAGDYAEISYTISVNQTTPERVDTKAIDRMVKKRETIANRVVSAIKFYGDWDKIKAVTLEYFIEAVHRQAEFCARAKNYAGPYIGIRDIFQQLEAALLWIPDYCREKIVEALNYIGDDGRAPRQYSYPINKAVVPAMDLRPYIDQGVWIISTVYRYLSYTDDFSILEEECGYYKFEGNRVEFSAQRDNVLSHLLRITDYLISNLDEKTGCLHALYGDWNDALDGLGKTDDREREYGSGVSVMTTLQFYRNLGEIREILKKLGRSEDAERYAQIRETMRKGVQKYAVVENENGERKIVHGWGDKCSYFVASYCDNDGESRDGLTSNAFWILSGAIDWDDSLKKDISAAYARLDSKYGIKTFEPYFSPENDKVGRITRLPKGTAENGAVYIHATLFAIWSLFEMGEDRKAWEQIYKILPLTHAFISTTPFVMPNSYIENSDNGFDGESMSDWFTGSGCVLLKVLYFCVFGLKADLDGITISPCSYIPFEKMETLLEVKGTTIKLCLKQGNGSRKFIVDGMVRYTDKWRVSKEDLKESMLVEVEL